GADNPSVASGDSSPCTGEPADALREAGDSSLALGMRDAQQAVEAAAKGAEGAALSAVEGADNPSVASGDSSPCTGEPADAANAAFGGQPVYSGRPVQQPYGQQPPLFGPQGNPEQPHQYQNNAAFGGYTSSVTGAGAPATPSPQGEGFAQPQQNNAAFGGFVPPVPEQMLDRRNIPDGPPRGQFVPNGQQGTGDSSPYGLGMTPHPSSPSATPPSPQGEGFAQPYGQQQYPQQQYQQPYGAPYGQPYGAPYAAPQQKKSKKGLWIAIVAIILVLGLAAVALFVWPGFLKGGSPIDGEWTGEYGETMTIGDGRISIDHGQNGTNVFEFTLDGDKLELTQISEMTYKVEGDELTLTVLGGEGTKIIATRVSGSGGIEGVWGDLRVVDEDGDSSSISGSTMEFNGGKYVSKQQYAADIEGDYEVSGDRIVVRNTSQKLSFTYTLEGDKLTFWRVNDDGEREKVEEYVRKNASGGKEPDDPLKGRWVGEYEDTLVLNGDGTGSYLRGGENESLTYKINGDKLNMTRGGENFNYTYELEDNALEIYEEDGEFVEAFYLEGTEPPKPKYRGAEVNGDWDFNIDDVDYSDMYDAMMGTAIESTGTSEAVRRILADESFKEALKPSITSLLSDYDFEFRDDGGVYMIIDAELYRDFMVKTQEAMIPLLREFTNEEAANYIGATVEELEKYLTENGITWSQYVDEFVAPNLGVSSQFDDATLEQMLGGTMNAYGEIETKGGTFTQSGDKVTLTGPAGDVTVFVMETDDLMTVESFTAPAGTSEAATALLDALKGLKFVRS
ncbi:MAG: hypothetical protein J5441_03090, partial [Clostridia bacterium]|nr:hypothetical protein [Clostridia bacterium]